MSLKEWAASQGITYITARRRYAAGTLPVPTYRLGRLIMVGEPLAGRANAGQVVVYAQVSSADQRADLDWQVARATAWSTGNGLAVDRVVTEVGSALNGRRKKFLALLRDPAVADVDGDLVRDVTEILTWRCARRYSQSAAMGRARRAIHAVARGEPA